MSTPGPTLPFATMNTPPLAARESMCLGTFVAQQFKLLSADPNTIFRCFLFPEQLLMMRIGVATQEAAVVAAIRDGDQPPVGLRAPTELRLRLPALEHARAAMTETSAPGLAARSREIPLTEIAGAHMRATGWSLLRGLKLTLRSGETVPLRFLTEGDQQVAGELLWHTLGGRFTSG